MKVKTERDFDSHQNNEKLKNAKIFHQHKTQNGKRMVWYIFYQIWKQTRIPFSKLRVFIYSTFTTAGVFFFGLSWMAFYTLGKRKTCSLPEDLMFLTCSNGFSIKIVNQNCKLKIKMIWFEELQNRKENF